MDRRVEGVVGGHTQEEMRQRMLFVFLELFSKISLWSSNSHPRELIPRKLPFFETSLQL